jgi:hypothetical protein
MPDIVAWYDSSQTDHAHQIGVYSPQGYRTLSLSAYNTPQDPRYACVMIKRPEIVTDWQLCGEAV